jgi:hypothetical protein
VKFGKGRPRMNVESTFIVATRGFLSRRTTRFLLRAFSNLHRKKPPSGRLAKGNPGAIKTGMIDD